MRALLRALLHRQTNSWLSETACWTGSHLLSSALPADQLGQVASHACISTVPKTTDRTPYRPAPDGSDVAGYWARVWRQKPDHSHKQRQPKDPKRIPRRMLHPTWETQDLEAFRDALNTWRFQKRGEERQLSSEAVTALVKAADQGRLLRDAALVLERVQQLQQLEGELPGVVAEQLMQRWPAILNRFKDGQTGPGQLDALMEQLDGLLGQPSSRQLAAGLLLMMPVRTVSFGSTLGKQLSELPSVWEEVLGVALDLQQLPPSAYVWASWSPKQQRRRLQTLKDRFGGEDAALVGLACPTSALVSDKQFMACVSTLQQLLGWQPGSPARHAAATHAQLLVLEPAVLEQRARDTQAQLQKRLLLSPAAARQQVEEVPEILLHPSQRWRDMLQGLVQGGLLPPRAGLQQQQQQQQQEEEELMEAVWHARVNPDPSAAAAMVARAPQLLLRGVGEVRDTVAALTAAVLPSQQVSAELPEEEQRAAQKANDEAVRQLLREEPQLLLLQPQEAAQRLEQLRKLGELSSSWAQRVQDMLHSNSHYARVLTCPGEQFDRVQQLVRSGTKDAPSDQELGLLDLLQMPAQEFKDMYPAAALIRQWQ